jgi:hypothetical protein
MVEDMSAASKGCVLEAMFKRIIYCAASASLWIMKLCKINYGITVTLCSLGKITTCEIKKGIVVFMLVLEVKKGIVVFKRKATPKVSFPFIY